MKWKSYITVNAKHRHLGLFTKEEDAARAFDKAARHNRGDRAETNFADTSVEQVHACRTVVVGGPGGVGWGGSLLLFFV